MIDLRKHFRKAMAKKEPSGHYNRMMEEASLAVARLIDELRDYGFSVQFDEKNTVIKPFHNRLDVEPRFIMRCKDREVPDIVKAQDYVDFVVRVSITNDLEGPLSALGVGKNVERLNVEFPDFNPVTGAWSRSNLKHDEGISMAAAIIVARYADRAVKNDMVHDLSERVGKYVRPAKRRSQNPGLPPPR